MSVGITRGIVEKALAGAGIPAPLLAVVSTPMKQRGRILSDVDSTRWYSLIEAGCRTTFGNEEVVPRVAAAFEVMIAALDVLDEIEDGDFSPLSELVGIPRAINASTMLIGLSQLILNDDELFSWDAQVAARLHQTLSEGVLRATIGQDADLQGPEAGARTVDDALRIARQKSGSLAATACRMGALLGTSDPELLSACYEFGLHYGTMAQIANDVRDSVDSHGKTDLEIGRPTLPIAYSLGVRGTETATNDETLAQGSLEFAWVVFETERIRCFKAIERVAELGCESKYLGSLIGE